MTKIAASEAAERPTPVQKQKRKTSPWETAPDFSSLVGQLLPKTMARTAPTAPMPGNAPRPVAAASIEEAVLALATQLGAAMLPEAPAMTAEGEGEGIDLPAVDIPTEAGAVDVSDMPAIAEELPSDEVIELAKQTAQGASQQPAPAPV